MNKIGRLVGKINKKIYSCITDDIVTDEVVLTNNQLEHIKLRHQDACELAVKYIYEALSEPDFIFRDKHPRTGLVVKAIKVDELHLQIVLRICTAEDEVGYKNSIISCWTISNSRLANYLRNKEVLYRKK